MLRRVLAVLVAALVWAAPAWATYDWGSMATISDTIGVTAGRLCMGESTRGDLSCPTYAPYVSSTSGYVGIGTSNPQTPLQVSGGDIRLDNDQGLLWGGIAVGVVGSGSVNTLRFYTNGQNRLHMTSAGYIGIGTTSPTVSLTVVGEVQVSNSGVSCSSTTAGAIRYTSGNLQYCNGTAFTSLVSGTTGLTLDNITSGTTKVTANSNGYISLTTGGSTTGYFDTSGRMVVPGISVTTAQTSVTSLYASGNVGVLTPSPTSALSVNGNIQLKTGEGLLIGVGTENDNTFSYVGASATVTLQHYSLSWKVADYSSGAQAHLSGWNGIQLYSRGAARATIDPTGRVGIATVYPSSTLHVSGTARITSWTMIGAAATPSATLDVSGTLKVAGTGSETCATENLGSFRRNPITGKMQICR